MHTPTDTKALYLELLIGCLSGTIYDDPPKGPWWDGKTFNPDSRTQGQDWPSRAHSMIGHHRLRNLWQLAERVLQERIPGDFIETGVWRGGACIFLQAVLKSNGCADRRIICADSFAGLPPPEEQLYPADAGDTHYQLEQLAIPVEVVRSNFEKYGLLNGNVEFLQGWFKDTLPTLSDRTFALIRLDGDMYSSTIEALQALYHRLSPGGFLVVDDYGAIPACKQAVTDFRESQKITNPIHEIDWTGVWWQKAQA